MSKIIEKANERNEFVTDVDGFIYYWPEGATNGYITADQLRELADELDRRNKKWDDDINKFFGETKKPA